MREYLTRDQTLAKQNKSSDDSQVDPPVPIPNTVVKHLNVESTWVETPWEDRKLLVASHF